MGNVIFVTGFKGGVGKTTVTSSVASCLNALGNNVLIVDGDFGMRCMDLVLGTESMVVYDCCDVLGGRCSLKSAVVNIRKGLDFLPAPMSYDGENPDISLYRELFDGLRLRYDYVLIDSGADFTDFYRSFASVADDAIVVSMHQSTAVRAAERTASMLSEFNLRSIRLVINGYRKKAAEAGVLPDALEIIHASSVRLIGIIPFDERISLDQERTIPVFGGDLRRKAKSYEIAFMNTAKRIAGKSVPLFEGQASPAKLKTYL